MQLRYKTRRHECSTTHTSVSAYGDGNPFDSDSDHYPRKRRRSGQLAMPVRHSGLKPVRFVSACCGATAAEPDVPIASTEVTAAGEWRRLEATKEEQSNSVEQQPGNLASNVVVAKMMRLMNYKEGAGLGKHGQGITTPIEVTLRPKNAGLGSIDGSTSREKNSVLPLPSAAHKWSPWSTKTVEAQEEAVAPAEVRNMVNMREPKPEVLMDLTDWNEDITHVLLSDAEVDLLKLEGELRCEKEKVASLVRKKEMSEKEEARHKRLLHRVEFVAGVVNQVESKSSSGTLTMDTLLRAFRDLKQSVEYEYHTCNLQHIVCMLVSPLLSRMFRGWHPLRNPSVGLDIMHQLKDLLDDASAGSPYSDLVGKVILPVVRRSAMDTWQAMEPEPMLRFLETWERLLPSAALQSLLEQVVLPKLTAAVAAWETWRDTAAMHTWVQPWLPLLEHRLESLYLTIRYKLRSVNHVADTTHSPWKDVLDAANLSE